MNTEIHRHDGMEWRRMTPQELLVIRRPAVFGVILVLNRLEGESNWAVAGLDSERYAEIFKDKT